MLSDRAIAGHTDFSVDDLLTLTRRPGFDLELDTWLIDGPQSEPIAFSMTFPSTPDIYHSFGVVHPDHLGRGLGTILLQHLEARIADLARKDPSGTAKVRNFTYANDRPAHALLEGAGFRVVRTTYTMSISLEGFRDDGDIPQGIVIEPVGELDESKARQVHEILEEVFEDEWGHAPSTFEQWSEQTLKRGDHDPTLWFLAQDDDRTVGVLLGNVTEGMGWVAALGTRKPWRKKGIGGALLRRSFAEFASRGLPSAALGVDGSNAAGAVSLYEGAGMHVVTSYNSLEKTFG